MIETCHRFSKTLKVSLVDPSTQLLNQRGFSEKINVLNSYKNDICLIYLNLDKSTFIHSPFDLHAYDSAILHFATLLKLSIQENHIAARLGHDEFAILVKGDIFDADQTIQRIRDVTNVTHVNTHGDVRFTSGIAVRKSSESMNSLLTKANQFMHRVKRKKATYHQGMKNDFR